MVTVVDVHEKRRRIISDDTNILQQLDGCIVEVEGIDWGSWMIEQDWRILMREMVLSLFWGELNNEEFSILSMITIHNPCFDLMETLIFLLLWTKTFWSWDLLLEVMMFKFFQLFLTIIDSVIIDSVLFVYTDISLLMVHVMLFSRQNPFHLKFYFVIL